MRIAVSCGGTGGHIFPGLATADELARRGHEVTVWLAGKAIEREAASSWKGRTVQIAVPGVGGRVSPLNPLGMVRMLRAVLLSLRQMTVTRPDAVLGMGSYASVGPVLAARLKRIPVVLHEANAICGRAVETLAAFSEVVALSFEGTPAPRRARRAVVTGLPIKVREGGREGWAWRKGEAFTVLVMGGSQGARCLNEVCPAALSLLAAGGMRVRAIHLCGPESEAAVKSAYATAGIESRVHAFLDQMHLAYETSDVAICRSGAASCWELALQGVPAIYVPLPWSARDHQRLNARHFAERGGAVILEQEAMSAERLAGELRALAQDGQRVARMRDAQLRLGAGEAAARLADLVEASAAVAMRG